MLVRSGSRVLGLALVALLVPLFAATTARAAHATCAVVAAGPAGPEGDVLRVADNSNSVTQIYRVGDEIHIYSNADRNPPVCTGAVPTVFNVDRIEYSTESSTPFINYHGEGPLAPGASPEPGADEIEITITEGYDPKVVNIAGTNEGERIEAGQLGTTLAGVNLNADADGDAQDADVTFSAPKRAFLRITARDGDDEISALGGPAFEGPFVPAERLTFAGGPGDDLLSGGPFRDMLAGNEGDDELLGGRGRDKLTIGPGRDLAKGGKGPDDVYNQSDVGGIEPDLFPDRVFGGAGDDSISVGQQLRGDRVECGAGRDDVFKDAGDITVDCEETGFR